MNATLDLADLARQFPHLLKLRKGLVVDKGRLILGAVLDSEDDALTVVVSAKTADLTATLNGRPAALSEPLVANLRGRLRGGAFTIDDARLSSSFASATATGTPDALDFSVTANLGAALAEARKFAALDSVKAAGKVKAAATVTTTRAPGADGPATVAARGSVFITDLECSMPALGADHPRIPYLNGTFDVTAAGEDIRVRRLQIDSSLATVLASNVVYRAARDGGLPYLALDADATVNLTEIAAQFPSALRLPEGVSLSPIRLSAKATLDPDKADPDRPKRPPATQWADFLGIADIDAAASLDRLQFFGLDLRRVKAPLAVHDSLARLSPATRIGEGSVRLLPLVDARPAVPFLTLAETGVVVSNVPITDAMMSDLFGRIHPLMRQCAVASGQTSLRLDALNVPLEKSAINRTEARGEFTTRNMVVAPAGALAEILSAAKLNPGRVQVADQTVTFACANGRIQSSPLILRSGEYKMTLSGSVGLDGTLDYVAEVPLTQELVGEEAYPYVRDTSVKLRITGTASKPVVDRRAIEKAVGDLVGHAVKNLIRGEGSKLLERLQPKKSAP
jgi:hypothetical protein